MVEILKYVKNILSGFHSNNQKYLYFDKTKDKWYFITDIYGEEIIGDHNIAHLSLVELTVKDPKFREGFLTLFQPLIDKMDEGLNHYLFKVSVLNKYINDCLKEKSTENVILNDIACLQYSRKDLFSFVSLIIQKITTGEKVEIVPIDPLTIDKNNLGYIEFENLSHTGKLRFPFKSGLNITPSSFMKNKQVEIKMHVYKQNEKLHTYAIQYTDESVEAVFYQPYRIFV